MSWIVGLRNISIIISKFIIFHESFFVLAVVAGYAAEVQIIHLSNLLLILLLVLLVPKSEIALILYLHRQVNWREGWIKWLCLLRREGTIVWSATLLKCPRLESPMTRLVPRRIELGVLTLCVKCQV